MTKIKLLPVDAIPGDKNYLKNLENALLVLNEKSGLSYLYSNTETGIDSTYQKAFIEQNTKCEIALCTDINNMFCYLMVESPSEELMPLLIECLSKELQVPSLKDLSALTREEISEDPMLLINLALLSGDTFNKKTFKIIKAIAGNEEEDEDARLFAINAIFFMKWPEFEPVIKKLIKQEDGMELQDYASAVYNVVYDNDTEKKIRENLDTYLEYGLNEIYFDDATLIIENLKRFVEAGSVTKKQIIQFVQKSLNLIFNDNKEANPFKNTEMEKAFIKLDSLIYTAVERSEEGFISLSLLLVLFETNTKTLEDFILSIRNAALEDDLNEEMDEEENE